MSLVGYRANNHPQQTGRRGAKDEIDDRSTTPEMYGELHQRFGFTLDVAADHHNAKTSRYYTKEDDGLVQLWDGARVWCNPPYSNVAPWVYKAWQSWRLCGVIVMLLPANRTEQRWWQEMVEPYRDRPDSPLSVEFLPGRPRFIRKGSSSVGPNERPPFGCCLLIWQHRQP
jgi:phage N-6-adenine-methyltransferase